MRNAVPAQGLATNFRGGTLRDLAREAVAIASQGLAARGRRNAAGADERMFLAPLQEIAAGGPTQAEHWLQRWREAWAGDVGRIFAEAAFSAA